MVTIHVQILFFPRSNIDDPFSNYLESFLESRTRHSILFMAIVAVPPLWKGQSAAFLLFCAIFILRVLYQPFI